MADYENSEGSNILVATGVLDPLHLLTELHLPDGKIVRLPTALLEASGASAEDDTASSSSTDLSVETIIPLVEERLQVSRRTVPTGTVRLEKTVQEYTTQLDEPLAVRTYDIERVILNRPVEDAFFLIDYGYT